MLELHKAFAHDVADGVAIGVGLNFRRRSRRVRHQALDMNHVVHATSVEVTKLVVITLEGAVYCERSQVRTFRSELVLGDGFVNNLSLEKEDSIPRTKLKMYVPFEVEHALAIERMSL